MDLRLEEVAHGTPAYDEMVELRQRVLRIPFGHPLTPEELADEFGQVHLAAYLGGRLVACLLLRPDGDGMQMRQVAVDPESQSSGIGRILVGKSEQIARREGAAILWLHARDTAVGFYEKLGYRAAGDWFEEIGIPHLRMAKGLA